MATPTLYVYDLDTNKMIRKYPLSESTKPKSYVNDLRVDREHGKIYFTDSNEPGLIVLDIKSGENYRMLDNHPYTTAEQDHITVNGRRHDGKVHSDGIALDKKNLNNLLNVVLLREIGSSYIHPTTLDFFKKNIRNV